MLWSVAIIYIYIYVLYLSIQHTKCEWFVKCHIIRHYTTSLYLKALYCDPFWPELYIINKLLKAIYFIVALETKWMKWSGNFVNIWWINNIISYDVENSYWKCCRLISIRIQTFLLCPEICQTYFEIYLQCTHTHRKRTKKMTMKCMHSSFSVFNFEL